MTQIAPDRRYSAEHEWVAPLEGTHVRIGVSHVASDALGEIVFVELPAVGSVITHGSVCGEIESTKSVSELFAPVSGVVVAVNDDVTDSPALINEEPYAGGWLFVVDVSAEGPLLSANEYAAANGADA